MSSQTVARPRPADHSTPHCGTPNGYYHHLRVLSEPACLLDCQVHAEVEKARRDANQATARKAERDRKRRYKGIPPERWRVTDGADGVPA